MFMKHIWNNSYCVSIVAADALAGFQQSNIVNQHQITPPGIPN